ncbi:PorT family protein [Taibaiella lutea]|uniref:PorT family protein n=1 Tax=Taibaiella lutea TaxID=2608001 RepID=A0A5M6CJX5_9BACT|nr:outer membrane beta-barrel protein [Taibaiella lutea]KAA5533655.1 PorT family protein [Taibaiella lutea]
MKKLTLLIATCILWAHTNAQQKWYIITSGAVGSSSIKQGSHWPEPYISSITGFNTQAKIGYHLKNWRLETGLQYKQTGYKQGLTFGSSFPDTMPTGYEKLKFREIAIPIDIGYQIPLSSRFKLVPSVGISTGFLLNINYATKAPDEKEHSENIGHNRFKSLYGLIHIWGNTALHIEYKLNNRFEIIAGPAFQYTLNDIMTGTWSFIPESNSIQHLYFLGGDIGLKVNL